MKKLTFTAVVVLLLVAGGVALMLRPSKVAPSVSSAKSDKVSVRMKWFFAGTMTGWFAGKDQGIFKDQGIDLEIRPGGPDNSSIKLVAAGTDQFGIAGADEVLIAREKGIPVIAIGVLFKESPICFISKTSKGITSPSQWDGKTIEVSYGDNSEIQFRALVKKFAVKNMKEVPYTFTLLPFIQDKVDVSVAYKMDQVVTLQNQGISLNVISARDYGINPYGDVVITTEDLLKSNPELVRKFMVAAVKSFRWSIANSDKAVSLLVSDTANLKLENEKQVWRETIPFLVTDGGEAEVGVMKPSRWSESAQLLLDFGALKKPVPLNEAYKNVISN